MSEKKPTRAAMQKVADKCYEMFSERANFTGLDIGYRWTDGKPTKEVCVRVHVQRKLDLAELGKHEVFPKKVDGVPLDVIRGPYRPSVNRLENKHDERSGWTIGGISCSRPDDGAGTIGAIVIDEKTGKLGVLSNWHVLAGPGAQAGDAVLQPGLMDGGHPHLDRIGVLSKWFLDSDGDAAMAQLVGSRPWLPLQAGTHQTSTTSRESRLGEVLEKAGRTTGVTRARVDGEGRYRVHYEVRPGVIEPRDVEGFKLVPETPGNPANQELSAPGDSGAVWISPGDGAAVGLHFAGEANAAPSAEHAIACNMPTVLSRLNVRLAGFEDLLASQPLDADEKVAPAWMAALSDPRDTPPPKRSLAKGPRIERAAAPLTVIDSETIRDGVTDIIADRYAIEGLDFWERTPKRIYRNSSPTWLNEYFYYVNGPVIEAFPKFAPGWDVPKASTYFTKPLRDLRVGLIIAVAEAYSVDPWEGL